MLCSIPTIEKTALISMATTKYKYKRQQLRELTLLNSNFREDSPQLSVYQARTRCASCTNHGSLWAFYCGCGFGGCGCKVCNLQACVMPILYLLLPSLDDHDS
ncbi:hypothetical protein PIB30_100586 [Stylosanthes scabra]|uniref:Uncharacterized protein n=1 Tax=Stylosanthes scabra TaxID=79078 RepID=A0ABU6UWS6_9FABA|nr:hypothetical protein [Stylosanthes scabra]